MTDPAVEAAQRAFDRLAPDWAGVSVSRSARGQAYIAVAREALAPIRAVIERWAAETNLPPAALTLLDEIRPLIYPSEEL